MLQKRLLHYFIYYISSNFGLVQLCKCGAFGVFQNQLSLHQFLKPVACLLVPVKHLNTPTYWVYPVI